MVADLEKQGIRAWIDQEGLVPGTPDWEEEVRRAIRSAQAVLFMASPGARSSLYVRDELDIARHHQRPVFPIWVAGEEWIEAVPLGWGRTQYIDARGAQYEAALAQLIQMLSTPSSRHMLNEISDDKESGSLQAFLATQVKQTPQTVAHTYDEMPSTDLREIQQREKTAQEIYHRLAQPDVTAIVLTGITFNNFGRFYYSLGEEHQALKSYGYALSKLKEVSDHLGEGSTLLNIGLLYFKQQRYDVALASFLLAKVYFERVQSPEYRKAEIQIDSLHEEVGEPRFAELLAKIESRELQIVKLALDSDIAMN